MARRFMGLGVGFRVWSLGCRISLGFEGCLTPNPKPETLHCFGGFKAGDMNLTASVLDSQKGGFLNPKPCRGLGFLV